MYNIILFFGFFRFFRFFRFSRLFIYLLFMIYFGLVFFNTDFIIFFILSILFLFGFLVLIVYNCILSDN